MNFKMVIQTLGRMLVVLGALLLLPALVSLGYGEACFYAFLFTAVGSAAAGFLLTKLFRPRSQTIYAREGFAIVALVWLIMGAVGALPFVLSGEVPSYADAFFETVSGFTTTGASVLSGLEDMSRGLLFWRSFSHWIGGMGVLVFIMAIVPKVSDRSIHILRAEMPGPVVGKLLPRVKDTAKILYLIYIVLTVAETGFLLAGGLSPFESTVTAFGTAGTGGFSVRSDGLAAYSPYLQWVVAVFMMLFGINFNLFYLILIRRFKSAFKSTELWVYFGVIAVSTALIASNVRFPSFGDTVRHAFFTVSSLVTTTGYATTDFNLWPNFSRALIFLLLFVGGCAGSTAGGLKMSRVILLCKMIAREFRRMLHPRAVQTVKTEGKTVDEMTLNGIAVYFALYMFGMAAFFLGISLLEPSFDFETNLSAVVSCFNNVGPGLADVGPMGGYGAYSDVSKYLLSGAMLLGRLEIFPLLFVFFPSTWHREK